MAKSHGVYRATHELGNWEMDLCFTCATRVAVKLDDVDIYFETVDRDYPTCDQCKKYIQDTVEV